jgi:aspartyl-tRNA(Asn)/glutamyl-tRNA(Gln) amidotransferase subunit A
MEICELSIAQVREMIGCGELTPAEVLAAHLARIDKCDGVINSYITVDEELRGKRSLKKGPGPEKGHETRALGQEPPGLAHIPLAIKDNICTKGLRTTCASGILREYVPPYDATAVARLRSAGCVILGKTNLDEFGMGSSTENSYFGATKNPWDASRVPGGSSGGSAAAVASGMAMAALGSDTGGSVRQPASLCGVVGFKPTYGVVSRRGLVAFASSLDQIGVIARSVGDVVDVLGAVSGWDAGDSTSARRGPVRVTEGLEKDAKFRVGVPWSFFSKGIDGDVLDVTMAAAAKLGSQDWTFEEVELPNAEYSIAAYYLVADAEASSNLARYDGVRYGSRVAGGNDLLDMYVRTRSAGFGSEVKRRIMLGTYALSAGYYDAYYLRAQKVRTLIKRDYERVLENLDFVLMPTSPTPAFRLGEKLDDPLSMYLSDVFTVGVNLAGLPAVSLPSGFSSQGLPVGLQLIGRAFDDARLLAAARVYERVLGVERRTPTAVARLLAG